MLPPGKGRCSHLIQDYHHTLPRLKARYVHFHRQAAHGFKAENQAFAALENEVQTRFRQPPDQLQGAYAPLKYLGVLSTGGSGVGFQPVPSEGLWR